MKTIFIPLSVVFFSLAVFADNITINVNSSPAVSNATNWVCKVKPFTKEFEGTGTTKTEARFKASKACKAENNEMHCKEITCEGEDPKNPAVANSASCKVTAFGETFEAMGSTKIEAKHNAMKKCTDKNNEMHCKFESCETD